MFKSSWEISSCCNQQNIVLFLYFFKQNTLWVQLNLAFGCLYATMCFWSSALPGLKLQQPNLNIQFGFQLQDEPSPV